MATKLPYNIKALIGDIGEKQVLLQLAIQCHVNPNWSVFQNLGEAGFDILLLNTVTNERRCIEVKTRQRVFSTAKNQIHTYFNLTDAEYHACDILIAYFLDNNNLFVVPKSKLKPVSGGRLWSFLVKTNKSGQPHPVFRPYINAWHFIHPDFAKNTLDVLIDADNEEVE